MSPCWPCRRGLLRLDGRRPDGASAAAAAHHLRRLRRHPLRPGRARGRPPAGRRGQRRQRGVQRLPRRPQGRRTLRERPLPGRNRRAQYLHRTRRLHAPRTAADRRAAEVEFEARDAAGRAWLREAFARARADEAAMVVIFMQANPHFDVPEAERAARRVDGFDRLLETLRASIAAFAKPVVLVHGDTHRYRLDNPLPHLTRVESYGSPDVGWVAVTVNPAPGVAVPVKVVPHLVFTGPPN